MTREEQITARLNAATPGPWADITTPWNDALEKYRKTRGECYHGKLTAGKSDRRTTGGMIISLPKTNGAGGNLQPGQTETYEERLAVWVENWQRGAMYPDFYEFHVVAGHSNTEFKWGKGGSRGTQGIDCGNEPFAVADRALIANAPQDLTYLLERVALLEQENLVLKSRLEGMVKNADMEAMQVDFRRVHEAAEMVGISAGYTAGVFVARENEMREFFTALEQMSNKWLFWRGK